MPYSVRGGAGSSTDPTTWATYDEARAAAGRYTGLGFVLGDGFAGIDLDGCRDRETGELTPGAQTIVDRFATYTEISPSGTGVKLFMRGVKPKGCGASKPGADFTRIEIYDTGRYFAVTGEAIGGHGFEDRSAELDALCRELWPAAPTLTYTRPSDAAAADDRVLSRARQYLARIPSAVSGARGHDQTYAAACAMVHGFGLDRHTAMSLLETEYNPRCQPPWSAKELAHKIDDAASKPHSKPFGWLRDSGVDPSKEMLTQEQLDVLGWEPVEPPKPDSKPDKPDSKPDSDADGQPKRVGLSNVTVDIQFFKDPDDPNKTRRVERLVYRRIDEISASMIDATGGWPKCAGGLLFSVRESPPGFLPTSANVRYFGQPVDLWAWVSEAVDPFWTKQKVHDDKGHPRTPATKEEFHRHLRDCAAQRFTSVSILPHEPRLPGIFYVPCELPTATGKRLAEFLAMLNPETEADRELMKANILTLVWGGPMGGRPAFVYDSDHGMGSGKTATAQAIADIVGGAFRINPREEWESVTKRLMSDRAMAQRCVLIDNVRSKLGGQEIENLITSSTIDGWRPYHGNFSRPNDLTVMITQNAARGTKDIATRTVIVKIGAPRHDEAFVANAAKFIEEHRPELIADALALLAGPVQGSIRREHRDRFKAWQDGVLARCVDPDGLAVLIAERREGLDSDSEEAEDVAAAIRLWVAKNSPPANEDGRLKITRDQMRGLLMESKLLPDDMGKRGVYSWLCNMLGSHGPLAPLSDAKSGDRVWLWHDPVHIPV